MGFFDPSISLVDKNGRPTELFYSWLLTVNTNIKPQTVATLPIAATALSGIRRFVNDSTTTTFALTVTGGSTRTVPVFCDGTNWRIG